MMMPRRTQFGYKRLSGLEDTIRTYGHNGSNKFVVQYKKQTSKAHATHSMHVTASWSPLKRTLHAAHKLKPPT